MAKEAVPDWDHVSDNYGLTHALQGLKVFWRLVSMERRRLYAAVGVLVIAEVLSLSLPLVIKLLVDEMPQVQQHGITSRVIGLVVLLFTARTLMIGLRRFIQEPLFLKAIIHLENAWPSMAHAKLLALAISYHDQENTGATIAKVSKGVERLIGTLADLFWTLFPALVYLVLNAILLMMLDWRLGLLFVLPIVPALVMHVKSFERIHPIWQAWEKQKEKSVGLFCQSILNIRTVQGFVAEERERDAHDSIRRSMETLDLASALPMQRTFFAVEMLIGLSFIMTMVLGLYFVHRGWCLLGTVTYIAITGTTTLQCLWSVVQVYTRTLRNLAAAERMYTLLNEPIDVTNSAQGRTLDASNAVLAFNSVTLCHSGKRDPLFSRFDLTITPGEMLALVGKSGAGKSSVVSLLTRTCDPTSGYISLGGIDVTQLDRDWYRKRFACVPQSVDIFDGTLRQNVVYAHPDASEEWIHQAIEAACLMEVMQDASRFPLGLETPVGERGVRLSGGEQQRVGIARAYIALLAGARVLVLDEATSSLDSASERVVQHFIHELRRKKSITIVVIAHRLSTIQTADKICVLDNGSIIESGTHAQLLKNQGLYHKLVQLQYLGELAA